MKVNIAGYNIDKSVLKKYGISATPETISAAYARISRSEKNIPELRQEALQEVKKARVSNQRIVFDMGHASIAEHAVFNIDIMGISRYLTEFIQKSRLASFTEKSQRYVKFDSDVVIPEEIVNNEKLHREYKVLVDELFELYRGLTIALKNNYTSSNDKMSITNSKKVKELANEDARYFIPLATKTQMGMTLNARSLEALLKRLASIDLIEAQQLYRQLIEQTSKIAPSLIRYIESDSYQREKLNINRELIGKYSSKLNNEKVLSTKIYPSNDNGEDYILAALLFEKYPQDFSDLLQNISLLSESDKKDIFEKLLSDMKFYHKAPQAFEMVDCVIQMSMSSCCFAQLKRHRIATIIRSPYNPQFGWVIPPSIETIRYDEQRLNHIFRKVNTLYVKLEDYHKGIGNYIITNAHRRNIIFKTNLRELYHFSRLRSDKHAQWEIRNISYEIDKQLKKLYPNACSKLMGKDRFKAVGEV